MMVIAYTRAADAESRKRFEGRVKAFAPTATIETFSDGLSGTVGFVCALRRVPIADFFVVDSLADLGRDVNELLDNLNLFASEKPQLYVIDGGFRIDARLTAFASALRSALAVHGERNRAIGVATARATGATIGRPKKFELDDVRRAAESCRNEEGTVSVRKLARALGCGVATASRYSKEITK
jgi:DNA invertase Pin-like site-specific DNA recombinase